MNKDRLKKLFEQIIENYDEDKIILEILIGEK